MAIDLDGAVTLVTGGANGIGTASARRLATRGARVVVATAAGGWPRPSGARRPWYVPFRGGPVRWPAVQAQRLHDGERRSR